MERRRDLVLKLEVAGFMQVRTISFVLPLLPMMLASRWIGECGKTGVGSDDLQLNRWLNTGLERVMDAERMVIAAGAGLPAGGCLLAVARRSA